MATTAALPMDYARKLANDLGVGEPGAVKQQFHQVLDITFRVSWERVRKLLKTGRI